MGKSGKTNNKCVKRLWTVVLKGGKPFELNVPFSGRVSHNGVHSLHHIYCDRETLDSILAIDADMRSEVISEDQSEEQGKERALLNKADWEKVFPTAECPRCFWFDLTTENLCGAKDWESEKKKASLFIHKKASKDLASCPLIKKKIG